MEPCDVTTSPKRQQTNKQKNQPKIKQGRVGFRRKIVNLQVKHLCLYAQSMPTKLRDRLCVPELVASSTCFLHSFGRTLANGKELNGFLYLLQFIGRERVHLKWNKKKGENVVYNWMWTKGKHGSHIIQQKDNVTNLGNKENLRIFKRTSALRWCGRTHNPDQWMSVAQHSHQYLCVHRHSFSFRIHVFQIRPFITHKCSVQLHHTHPEQLPLEIEKTSRKGSFIDFKQELRQLVSAGGCFWCEYKDAHTPLVGHKRTDYWMNAV